MILEQFARVFGTAVESARLLVRGTFSLATNALTAILVAAAATAVGWQWGPVPVVVGLALASLLALSLWARALLQGRLLGVQPGVVAGALLYSARHLPVLLVALVPVAWWSLVPLLSSRRRVTALNTRSTRWQVAAGETLNLYIGQDGSVSRDPPSPSRQAPPLPAPPGPPQASPLPTREGHREGRPAPSQRYRVGPPRARWGQVVGMRPFLDELERIGRRSVVARSMDGENGILLHGEPGNGKTTFAHALADRLGLPILEASIGQVKSMWVNETGILVAELFEAARAQAPCLLFLDEASSLLQRRDSGPAQHAEDDKATTAFLQELERTRGEGVLVVAAANDVASLDPAAVRPGRFDYRLLVPPPDDEARGGLIRDVLGAQQLSIADEQLAQVSPFWDGFSVSMVREVAKKAARRAKDLGQRAVDAAALEAALREHQGGESELRKDVPALDTLIQTPEVDRSLRDLRALLAGYRAAILHGIRLERGAVFCGPPGTGKTLGAQALASALGWNFVQTTGTALLDRGAVKALFAKASRLRPCIVLVDEADPAMEAGSLGHAGAVVRELQQYLHGATAVAPGAYVIACTNHPDRLDPALTRPGRLERRVEFPATDTDTARRFVSWWVKKRRVELHYLPELESLTGRTFAELERLLDAAYLRAVGGDTTSRPKLVTIHQHHFELDG